MSESKYMLPTSFGHSEFFGKHFDVIVGTQLFDSDALPDNVDLDTWKKKSRAQRAQLNSNINCIMVNLLLNGVLNFDGTCDLEYSVVPKKRELWAYIFYLWFINYSKLDIFFKMGIDDPTDNHYKPDPARFVQTIRDTLSSHGLLLDPYFLHNKDLMQFINHVFKVHQQDVQNPKLLVLFSKVEQMIMNKEDGLVKAVKTIQTQVEDAEKQLMPSLHMNVVDGEKELASETFPAGVVGVKSPHGNAQYDIFLKQQQPTPKTT